MTEHLAPFRIQPFKFFLELLYFVKRPPASKPHYHPGPHEVLHHMTEWHETHRSGACSHEILWGADGEQPDQAHWPLQFIYRANRCEDDTIHMGPHSITSHTSITRPGANQGCDLFSLIFSLYTNDCTHGAHLLMIIWDYPITDIYIFIYIYHSIPFSNLCVIQKVLPAKMHQHLMGWGPFPLLELWSPMPLPRHWSDQGLQVSYSVCMWFARK